MMNRGPGLDGRSVGGADAFDRTRKISVLY